MEHLSQKHAEWLENRGLNPENAHRLGIYSDKQATGGRAIVVPIVRQGQIINRQYRDVFHDESEGKKLWMDPNADFGFYHEDIIHDESLKDQPLVITEGPFDMYAAYDSGWVRVVSVPNGVESNLDFIHDKLDGLRDISEIILCVDKDDAGTKLGKALLEVLSASRCSYVNYYKGCKDLGDVLQAHGLEGVRTVLENAKPYPVAGLYKLSDYPDIPSPKTYSTGWRELDEFIVMVRGEFFAVTGIPSHGKSLWTTNLMGNMAQIHKHRICMASFEMPVVPYIRNDLRCFFNQSCDRNQDFREADKWINDYFVFVDPAPVGVKAMADMNATMDWVIEKAEAAVIRHGVDWFLIDPWNQINHEMGREGSAEYQRRAIMACKEFARRFDCGVGVVAHPTKDVKLPNGNFRKPNLYDIDGSAHWYNAADHGIVVDRDLESNKVEIEVKKARFRGTGKAGSAWLEYNFNHGRYLPVDKPSDYDNYSG